MGFQALTLQAHGWHRSAVLGAGAFLDAAPELRPLGVARVQSICAGSP